MIALSLKLDIAKVWENSGITQLCDNASKLQDVKEQAFFDTALDVASGSFGVNAQRHLIRNSGAQYMKRYVGKVMNRQVAIKKGVEASYSANDTDNGTDTLNAGVPEYMLGYYDDGFESVCRREEAVGLLKQLKRLRVKMLCNDHVDLYVLLYSLYNACKRKEDMKNISSVDTLRKLCTKYALQDFMKDLMYNEYISIEDVCCPV